MQVAKMNVHQKIKTHAFIESVKKKQETGDCVEDENMTEMIKIAKLDTVAQKSINSKFIKESNETVCKIHRRNTIISKNLGMSIKDKLA